MLCYAPSISQTLIPLICALHVVTLTPLDHLPDPLLSQPPFQARIARPRELDDALGAFTSGREGFKLGLMHVVPSVWLLGGYGFGGCGGGFCSFRVRGGHDDRVLV
jgi:hypothetical protein